MKISHLLALALVAFIVYRLTEPVQNAPAPAPPPTGTVEYIQTDAPARSLERDGESRKGTDSLLKSILQRLAAPARATPSPAASESIPSPAGQPAVAVATPVPLSPREQLRLSEARRPALERQYGEPRNFRGILRQHMPDGTVLVDSSELGYLRVEDYPAAQQMPVGAVVDFEAWSTGNRGYHDPDGRPRSALYLIHANPPLPLWDHYGRPINRDVLPPESIQKAGIHTETMLDRKSK